MIGKQKKGKGFRGVLQYALEKEGATLIGGNMLGTTPRDLAHEFGISRQLKPRLGRAVYHCSLSLAPDEHLTDEQWEEIVQRYLQEMGFLTKNLDESSLENSQFIVVRHVDVEHEHVHLIASRIRLNGTVVSDSHDYRRSEQAIRQIEKIYELQPVACSYEFEPDQVAQPRITRAELELSQRLGVSPPKLLLAALIDQAVELCDGQPELLEETLEVVGVQVTRRWTNLENRQTEVTFSLSQDVEGMVTSFTGNTLGRDYAWHRIVQRTQLARQSAEVDCQSGGADAITAIAGEPAGVVGTAGTAGTGDRQSTPDLAEQLESLVGIEFQLGSAFASSPQSSGRSTRNPGQKTRTAGELGGRAGCLGGAINAESGDANRGSGSDAAGTGEIPWLAAEDIAAASRAIAAVSRATLSTAVAKKERERQARDYTTQLAEAKTALALWQSRNPAPKEPNLIALGEKYKVDFRSEKELFQKLEDLKNSSQAQSQRLWLGEVFAAWLLVNPESLWFNPFKENPWKTMEQQELRNEKEEYDSLQYRISSLDGDLAILNQWVTERKSYDENLTRQKLENQILEIERKLAELCEDQATDQVPVLPPAHKQPLLRSPQKKPRRNELML